MQDCAELKDNKYCDRAVMDINDPSLDRDAIGIFNGKCRVVSSEYSDYTECAYVRNEKVDFTVFISEHPKNKCLSHTLFF